MCGIAGHWVRENRYDDCAHVQAMVDTLVHRGPDDGGVWVDSSAGIGLGHRRLAIIDRSPAGHQPMMSSSGRYVVVFNGEIYNNLELREEIDKSGGDDLSWRGHSDTETLLAAFSLWGIKGTLRRIIGMFAIALWDRKDRLLTLIRDRLGEKPLYYGWQNDTFLFGSELKALKAHPHFNARIDRNVLALYLRHNYVPAPYSIYEGISKLPPGTYIQLGSRSQLASPISYWSLKDVAEHGTYNTFQGSDKEAVAELERILGKAITSQMVADVPLGALLSGGLDSTLITALMQANSEKSVRTFSVGFNEKTYDEAKHASAVARHLGTDHTELYLTSNAALELVPQMPLMFDEPFADSSQLPTHLVMKMARKHVTVALSGDGGDEAFGGYNRYIHAPRVWNRIGWMPPTLRNLTGSCLTAFPSNVINQWAGPIARRLGIAQPGDKAHKLGERLSGLNCIDDLYVSLVSEWRQVDQMVIGANMPENLLDDRDHWPSLENPVARMMFLDAMTYLADDILVKVDRSAMATSLETRAPFLDRDLVEFSWALPMHFKIRDGQGKWILRRLLDRFIPRELIERPKMGFGIPLDEWLRGPLLGWADELLRESRLRSEGYLNPKPIVAAWKDHKAGKASYGYRLWSVLMFQAWLEKEQEGS